MRKIGVKLCLIILIGILVLSAKQELMCVNPETAKFIIQKSTVTFTIRDTNGTLIEFSMPEKELI
jgi:hypothetical protein